MPAPRDCNYLCFTAFSHAKCVARIFFFIFVGVLRIRLMKESSEPDIQHKRQRFSNEFKIYKTQKQIWL